jgi:hypothetical protein
MNTSMWATVSERDRLPALPDSLCGLQKFHFARLVAGATTPNQRQFIDGPVLLEYAALPAITSKEKGEDVRVSSTSQGHAVCHQGFG